MGNDELAQIIWDYMHMNQKLERADGVLVLGSHDTRVGEFGAELVVDGWAPFLILSGGEGRLTKGLWGTSEAEKFASIAREKGIKEEAIVIEDKSTNTGENIRFTKQLLEDKGMELRDLIVVQKPYMERRTYATFKKQWPEMKFIVQSPPISFDDYPNDSVSKEDVINIMVGDLQRIKQYPAKGYQIEQEIPTPVWEAYEELTRRGYTKHIIAN